MPPTSEEFARWRDDSVTRWVMAAHMIGEADQRAAWLHASWDGGQCNPLLLKEYRTRADAYRALLDASYEDFCRIHGEEAIYDER